jgi:deoxyribodipyrimidine photo-lyase
LKSIHWFRRDLRINDNPAFNEACKSGEVLPVVLIDPNLWPTWGASKQAYLIDSLSKLNESLNGNLVIKHGSAVDVIPEIAKQFEINSVHYAADFSEHGIHRDTAIKNQLESLGIEFIATGSGYAVAPGRVTKDDGTFYKVYTPFYKTWVKHGWRAPVKSPKEFPKFIGIESSDGLPTRPDVQGVYIPPAGELAALERWKWFKKNALADYSDNRNRPDLDGTSKLSTALKWGEIHPRTLLADLNDSPGHETYRKEIAWREFYADILFNRQDTVEGYYNPLYAQMKYDTGKEAEQNFEAWKKGETGYPFVDAGMRQLLAEGWIHNRVRMVVASFLVKDLHLEWQLGARHFMQWLLDGDFASNSHGWQWTAGCGTDASPYYRVFNPIGQGIKFDPTGEYIRKYIPELRQIPDVAVHEPWKVLGGLDHGYPSPIVDHAMERLEALDRLAKLPKAKS